MTPQASGKSKVFQVLRVTRGSLISLGTGALRGASVRQGLKKGFRFFRHVVVVTLVTGFLGL